MRQGDVLLTRVSELPKDAVPAKGLTVAYGEATGHHHTFTNGRRFTRGTDQFVVVEQSESVLEHQEHDALCCERGVWLVESQRQKSASGQIRPVTD